MCPLVNRKILQNLRWSGACCRRCCACLNSCQKPRRLPILVACALWCVGFGHRSLLGLPPTPQLLPAPHSPPTYCSLTAGSLAACLPVPRSLPACLLLGRHLLATCCLLLLTSPPSLSPAMSPVPRLLPVPQLSSMCSSCCSTKL